MSEVDIRQGDCREVMAQMERGSVDAIVTDPPYCAGAISEAQRTGVNGQGLRSENLRRFGWFVGDNMGTAGLSWLLRLVAFDAVRVVKSTGHMLVFCDWRMLPTLEPSIESAGIRYQGLIVWDKGAMGLGRGFRAQHELVMHFTFGEPEYHDLGTANVLRCARVGQGREHQAEKPVDLLRMLIRVVSPPGGLILDPFCGSGSTGVAAAKEGRAFIGIDRDADHLAIARRRLDVTSGPLFMAGINP